MEGGSEAKEEVRKVDVGGFSLSVRISGSGENGNIVLIHCLGLSSRIFDDQIKFLAGKGFRVFAPDVRCHGNSDKPESECSMDDLVDDIEKLFEKIGLSEIYALGGLSMGGMITMRLALRNPGIAQKLILMGTSADEEKAKEKYMPMIENLIKTAKEGRDEEKKAVFRNSAEFLVRLCFTPSFLADERTFEMWVEEAMKSQGLGGVYVAKAVILRDSILDKIHKINTPTLVMAGTEDVALPPEEARKISERITGSKLVMFEGAGHVFTPEKPNEVNSELEKFLL